MSVLGSPEDPKQPVDEQTARDVLQPIATTGLQGLGSSGLDDQMRTYGGHLGTGRYVNREARTVGAMEATTQVQGHGQLTEKELQETKDRSVNAKREEEPPIPSLYS